MTITSAAAANTTTEEINIVIPASFRVHMTENGPVSVINPDFAPKKMVDLLMYALKDPKSTFVPAVGGIKQGHGIHLIDFRLDGTPYEIDKADGKKQMVNWMYYFGSRAIVCNIKRCVTSAFNAAIGEGFTPSAKYQNIRHVIWQNILCGALHEMHHAQAFIDDSKDELRINDKACAKEEDAANEFARLSLLELAKQVDIEPELNTYIKQLIETTWKELEIDESEEDYIIEFRNCQNYMANTNDAWVALAKDTETDHHIMKTYREFLHYVSNDDVDDKAWLDTVPSAASYLLESDEWLPTAQVVAQVVPQNSTDQVYTEEPINQEQMVNQQQQYQQPITPTPASTPVATNMGYPPEPDMGYTSQVAPTNQYQQDNQTAPMNQQQFAQTQQPVQPQQQFVQTQQPVNNNVVVGAKTYDVPQMDAATIQAVVKGLYYKIYTQIFDVCGFNPTGGQNVPFFFNSGKITDSVPLTPEESMLVKEIDCYDAQGVLRLNQPVNGYMAGRFIDKNNTLPGFVLVMSDTQGNRIMRKFLPQNPWKVNANGQYSQTAIAAQNGHRILWILDPNAVDKQFSTRIYDGELQTNTGGSWKTV